ncbi:MAG: putative 2-hydroxypenta-2,4-dienoate hydratase, partial [Frankiales bacterium]|nr:putative 2-hydroxypenta-2,4-dienoate hydratase [Frankiales bacterium]
EQTQVAIPPLVQTFPHLDVTDTYEIQLLNIRRRLAAGATVYGHKVGLSSKAMQEMMGVDEPDYGHLLSDMVYTEDTPIPTSKFLLPRVEVEVGFVLGADLPAEGCTVEDVLRCTDFIAPAIELIDSRIADWKIGLLDTISDNASSCGVVLGKERVKPSDLDLKAIDAVLEINGAEVARGTSGAVLGDPTIAVAWLANKVAAFGVRLEAGHVVLPGSCTRAYDVKPGDDVVATFAGLGSVSLSFS